jgi:glycerol-3-phosphate acyltransferase PlsY
MWKVILIICGYLLGSIPSAYLAGRWIKKIDLRQYGSGTVSGSMVWEHVAKWAVFPAGIFDIAKAILPTWLGIKLGYGELFAVFAGLAAVIGHNWPIYLKFTGGRGISPFLGILCVIFPWGIPWLLGFLAFGYLLGDSAPWTLASMITLPLLAHWISASDAVFWASGIMLLITFVKRLEANRRGLPEMKADRRKIIIRRLFLDRDIISRDEWINRRPLSK